MTIKLRVVGIFYSVELDAKSVSGGSVQDVLDAAVKNPGSDRKFGYISSVWTLEPPSLSLSTFSAVYNRVCWKSFSKIYATFDQEFSDKSISFST